MKEQREETRGTKGRGKKVKRVDSTGQRRENADHRAVRTPVRGDDILCVCKSLQSPQGPTPYSRRCFFNKLAQNKSQRRGGRSAIECSGVLQSDMSYAISLPAVLPLFLDPFRYFSYFLPFLQLPSYSTIPLISLNFLLVLFSRYKIIYHQLVLVLVTIHNQSNQTNHQTKSIKLITYYVA
jgi:hypothetical protein